MLYTHPVLSKHSLMDKTDKTGTKLYEKLFIQVRCTIMGAVNKFFRFYHTCYLLAHITLLINRRFGTVLSISPASLPKRYQIQHFYQTSIISTLFKPFDIYSKLATILRGKDHRYRPCSVIIVRALFVQRITCKECAHDNFAFSSF